METRKITVVKTAGQNKVVINSGAETLDQLKNDLRENGISYGDMTFYEALSRTSFVDDNSILPTNVPFKGTTTNELIIMLSLTNKKIKSGAIGRKEAAAFIKENNLGDKVKKAFGGRNWTQVGTDDLVAFVKKNGAKDDASAATNKPVENKADVKTPAPKKASNPATPVTPVAEVKEIVSVKPTGIKAAISQLVAMLSNNSVISTSEAAEVIDTLGSVVEVPAPKVTEGNDAPYSDAEIAKLTKGLV